MSSNKKKTVLVTGTSSGIGEATARFLAKKGWTVFAGVRKEADAQRLRSVDVNIKPVILDVTKEDQVQSAMEEIRVAVGEDGLDALINNAGLFVPGPIEFTSREDIMLQFNVNLFGAIRMIQAAMPLIRMGVPGRIINVGSIASEFRWPQMGAYSATKSALATITESFRREVAMFGIKATLIQLGPVKTHVLQTSSKRYEVIKSQMTEGSSFKNFYGKALDKFMEVLIAMNNNLGLEVTPVAQLVHQALIVDDPKNVYYDSWSSWWNVMMCQWMPYTWNDASIYGSLGVKE